MNANYVLIALLAAALVAVCFLPAWPQDDDDAQVQCTTITYQVNGRLLTCQSCFYPGSRQVVVSNCVGG